MSRVNTTIPTHLQTNSCVSLSATHIQTNSAHGRIYKYLQIPYMAPKWKGSLILIVVKDGININIKQCQSTSHCHALLLESMSCSIA